MRILFCKKLKPFPILS